MGEFVINFKVRDTTVLEQVLPNFVHDEGKEYLLRQVFPPNIGAQGYEIGVSGIAAAGPNGSPLNFYDETTPYVVMTHDSSNEGGASTAGHRAALGYSAKTTWFHLQRAGGFGMVRSEQVAFHHPLDWTPTPDSWWHAKGWIPPDHKWFTPNEGWQPWRPVHGYPWDVPLKRRDADDPPSWMDLFYTDFRRAVAFPVSVVWLGTSTAPKRLLFSASMKRPVALVPESTLYVHYRGRLWQ
jgi:hypothetical protein